MSAPVPVQPSDANVFVIEDNADNLFIIQVLLREDLRVRWNNARASGSMFFKWLNTGELMRLNAKFQLHLILLDIQIPREDGYAILKQIREHSLLKQTRVVAVTANVLPSDVARARDAGFDGFIGKPLDRNRFPAQIRRILQGESVWEPA